MLKQCRAVGKPLKHRLPETLAMSNNEMLVRDLTFKAELCLEPAHVEM